MSIRSNPKPSDGAWPLFDLASNAPNLLSLRALALFLLLALAGVAFDELLLEIPRVERSPGVAVVVLEGPATCFEPSISVDLEVFRLCRDFLVDFQHRRHSVVNLFSVPEGDDLLRLGLSFFRCVAPSMVTLRSSKRVRQVRPGIMILPHAPHAPHAPHVLFGWGRGLPLPCSAATARYCITKCAEVDGADVAYDCAALARKLNLALWAWSLIIDYRRCNEAQLVRYLCVTSCKYHVRP